MGLKFEDSSSDNEQETKSKSRRARILSSSDEEACSTSKPHLPTNSLDAPECAGIDDLDQHDSALVTKASSENPNLLIASDGNGEHSGYSPQERCELVGAGEDGSHLPLQDGTVTKCNIFKSNLLTASDIESDNSDHEELKHKSPQSCNLGNADKQGVDHRSSSSEEDVQASKEKKKKKPKKKLDPKLAIRSETQRMERETHINLPYHKPKQRSLREFLSRKKNQLKADSLRLTSATMIHAWKEIDESIRDAAHFFKSESEEEEEGNELNDTESLHQEANDSLNAADNMSQDLRNLVPERFAVQEGHEIPDETNGSDNANNTVDGEVVCKEKMEVDSCNQTQPELNVIAVENIPVAHTGDAEKTEDIAHDHTEITNEEKTEDKIASVGDETIPKNPAGKNDVDLLGITSCSSEEKTGKWLEDLVAFEKRETLRSKLQLSPSVLNKFPVLSTDANEFIDLDDSQQCQLYPGAKQLMERMLKGRKQVFRRPVGLNTTTLLRDAAGEILDISVETTCLSSSPATTVDNSKPGAKLQKLREKLLFEMEAKWEEEFKKRCPDPRPKAGYEEDVAEDGDDSGGEEDVESSSSAESEPEEEDIEVKEQPRKFCVFGDSEAEESAEEGDNEEEEGDSDSDESEDKEMDNDEGDERSTRLPSANEKDGEGLECSLPAFQPGGGLLMGGSALTQQTQPLPLGVFSPTSSPAIGPSKNAWTPGSSRVDPVVTPRGIHTPRTAKGSETNTTPRGVKKNLFGDSTPSRQDIFKASVDDADDPFLFVSGAFPETAPLLTGKTDTPSTQFIPKRFLLPEESDDSQPYESNEIEIDCKIPAELPTSLPEGEQASCDGDQAVQDEDDPPISVKKKKQKLNFSDDEDDAVDSVANENNSEDEVTPSDEERDEKPEEAEVDEEEGEPQEVDYDSEENEVVRPGEFVEGEAELSESEWSGDEDEQGLDKLEVEEGDADVLDEEKVASQLGRIHMRRLLDDDTRNVRILKEMLLEDGDLHTDEKGRDRKFRWKNLAGFDLNGDAKGEECGSDGEGDDGDGNLAKLRHEKTLFLQQQHQEGKLEKIAEEASQEGDELLKLGRHLLQRLQPRPVTTTATVKSARARGSFLAKGNEFLTGIARSTTAGGTDGPLGPTRSRNFVFAVQEKEVITEEVVVIKEGQKRKAIGCQETVKRSKLAITVGNQPSLLDQLF